MSVRQASQSDARKIAEIHIASWQVAYRGMLPDGMLDSLSVDRIGSYWETTIENGTNLVLLCEENSQIIGFASFGASRDDDVGKGKTGEIYSIYLDPLWWGKGHGSVLIAETMMSLKDMGFLEATLWVLRDNKRAIRFYEKLNFKADGSTKVETRKDGTELHEIRYRQRLNEEAHNEN